MRKMRALPFILAVGFVAVACAHAGDNDRMFGKFAKMREVAGSVMSTGTNWWGARYIIVQDRNSGLKVYIQPVADTCVPGKMFRGSGHMSREAERDYDTTFHIHLSTGDEVCT